MIMTPSVDTIPIYTDSKKPDYVQCTCSYFFCYCSKDLSHSTIICTCHVEYRIY